MKRQCYRLLRGINCAELDGRITELELFAFV